MANPDNAPIDEYKYGSAARTSLATPETALALDRKQIAEREYDYGADTSTWPKLSWRRGEDAAQGSYGRLFIHDKVSPAEFMSGLLKERGETAQANWFHDFNNLPEGAHYEPYLHDGGNWSNRLIKRHRAARYGVSPER